MHATRTVVFALPSLVAAAPRPITSASTSSLYPRSDSCTYSVASIPGTFRIAATPKPTADDLAPTSTWLSVARVNLIDPHSDQYLLSATPSYSTASTFTFDDKAQRLRTIVSPGPKGTDGWGYHSADPAAGAPLFLRADDGTALPESALTTVRVGDCGTSHLFFTGGSPSAAPSSPAYEWSMCKNPALPQGEAQLFFAGDEEAPLRPECVRVQLMPMNSPAEYAVAE